jgi:hypothetical protein
MAVQEQQYLKIYNTIEEEAQVLQNKWSSPYFLR